MRGLVSTAIVILVGCAPTPKPPSIVEVSPVRQAPPARDASPPDPLPVERPPSESPAASASSTAPASEPSESTDRRPTAAEERECAARGGTIQPICMMGELACVIRYRDGGKRCSDDRDCIGGCLYEGPDPPPPKATGVCQRTSDPCGCKAAIHHGHVEPALCAD